MDIDGDNINKIFQEDSRQYRRDKNKKWKKRFFWAGIIIIALWVAMKFLPPLFA